MVSNRHDSKLQTTVLLATALVPIKTVSGRITVRAFLDQGSQASLMTERGVQMLGLKRRFKILTIMIMDEETGTI